MFRRKLTFLIFLFLKGVNNRFMSSSSARLEDCLKNIAKPELIPVEYWKKIIWIAKDLKHTVYENGKKNLKLLDTKHVTLLFDKPQGRFQLAFTLACDLLGARHTVFHDPNFENQPFPGDSGSDHKPSITSWVDIVDLLRIMRILLPKEDEQYDFLKFYATVMEAISFLLMSHSQQTVKWVLSMLTDMFVIHGLHHNVLIKVVSQATVPVFSASSDVYRLQKALSDLMTFHETLRRLKGLKLAWIGPPNPIFNAYLILCSKFDIKVHYTCVCSHGTGRMSPVHRFPSNISENVLLECANAMETVSGAHIVATSMHLEENNKITLELLKAADPNFVFIHSLPRSRNEVTEEVFNHKNNVSIKTFENYLFVAMAVILTSLTEYQPKLSQPDFDITE